MLESLYIKNYALIRELKLHFDRGLVVLTGETGSGKSILLGALGLIMGDRADNKVVFNQDEKCIVEAQFRNQKEELKDFFRQHDLDWENQISIRREINKNGKSRAFINDTPVQVSTLQAISSLLLDLHQQFDTMELLGSAFPIDMLDALAGNMESRTDYAKKFKIYIQTQQILSKILAEEKQWLAEKEFIQFQLAELQSANWIKGEQESLDAELNMLNHAEDIQRLCSQGKSLIQDGEFSLLQLLPALYQTLQHLSKLAPSIQPALEQIDQFRIELTELVRELDRIEEHSELDPMRLQVVQERVQLLQKQLKKHQALSLDDLLKIKEKIEQKLMQMSDAVDQKHDLELQVQQLFAELSAQAEGLSQSRQAIIPELIHAIESLLAKMNMNQTRIKIELMSGELNKNGKDIVQIKCSTNKGSDFLLLKDIASGGELSRIALSIKSVVGKALALPTMIFDEIDTGVSGQVALQMGQILKGLSERQQVLVITHTPQVAARADQHIVVFKDEDAMGAFTQVKVLSEKDRIHHLAVMLSTDPPSASALANAKELIHLT